VVWHQRLWSISSCLGDVTFVDALDAVFPVDVWRLFSGLRAMGKNKKLRGKKPMSSCGGQRRCTDVVIQTEGETPVKQ